MPSNTFEEAILRRRCRLDRSGKGLPRQQDWLTSALTLSRRITRSKGQLITQCLRSRKIYHSLYAVNMVCELREQLSGFVCAWCPTTNATHNDSPANVKTYDFVRIVSFRGHSQYLATCAKMTPWQRDCRMPSMRMGALTGTSVSVAREDTMAVDVGEDWLLHVIH